MKFYGDRVQFLSTPFEKVCGCPYGGIQSVTYANIRFYIHIDRFIIDWGCTRILKLVKARDRKRNRRRTSVVLLTLYGHTRQDVTSNSVYFTWHISCCHQIGKQWSVECTGRGRGWWREVTTSLCGISVDRAEGTAGTGVSANGEGGLFHGHGARHIEAVHHRTQGQGHHLPLAHVLKCQLHTVSISELHLKMYVSCTRYQYNYRSYTFLGTGQFWNMYTLLLHHQFQGHPVTLTLDQGHH